MKTKAFLSALAITALLCVACDNDDEATNDGRVKFFSGVNDLQTRVGGVDGNTWGNNDAIGIYMVGNGTTTVAEGASNVRYTTTSTTATAEFTSTSSIYYPVSGAKVDFIAYHPHNATITGYAYPVDVSSQSKQSAIDLMWAKADGTAGAGYDKTNTAAVSLKFYHQLAKVVINVTAGDGVANLNGLTVFINGMNTTAGFAIDTHTLDAAGDVEAITPYSAGSNTYEAILLPVTLGAAHIVEFAVGGNTYKWTMTDNDDGQSGSIAELTAGNKHTFNITLNKTKVKATGEIVSWGNGGIATGSAN